MASAAEQMASNLSFANFSKATELKTEMDAKSDRSMLQQIGAGVLISILAVLALWFSSRSVALPIRKAAQLAGASVSARVVGAAKGPKVIGFTYKNKANERRRWGHRQHYATIEITGIKKG